MKPRFSAFTGLWKTLLILFVTVLFVLLLNQIGLQPGNILMVYVIGILIVILQTKSFWYGAVSALFCVISFNYLFTEPKYTLMVNDPNYYASFIIFLIVAFMVSTLTAKLQKEIATSQQNEKTALEVYRISSGYLTISGKEEVLRYGQESIEELTGRRAYIYPEDTIETMTDNEALQWCYETIQPCGFGELRYAQEKEKYIPMRSADNRFGVVAIDCAGKDLSPEELLSVNTILTQIVLAAQREILSAQQEESRMRIEKEKLKNNLLRSISHDLRTPLTGISASAEFLKESLKDLDGDTVQSLLDGIRDDADWLGNMVENLLNMTRIQDGKLVIHSENEVVDEIIGAAVTRISKYAGTHTIRTVSSDEILVVPMDRQLIVQVLVNLLDNAIRHSRPGSTIELSARKGKDAVYFEVSDDGGGIRQTPVESIFESFVSGSSEGGDHGRGTGLGLNICQSIVHAHGGIIGAYNNNKGGATVYFTLPPIKADE